MGGKKSEEESVNGIVPMGKVMPGFDFVIIEENLNEVNTGEVGELCFSGDQVIKNYLNNENKEKFLSNLYKGQEKIFYRTGDLACLNSFGNLVFHGRTDSQVKILGHRIELGEIDFWLRDFTKSPVVSICIKDERKLNRIVSFVQCRQFKSEELFALLREKLPEYMLPQDIVFLDEIPMNINGKFNQEALRQYIRNI